MPQNKFNIKINIVPEITGKKINIYTGVGFNKQAS